MCQEPVGGSSGPSVCNFKVHNAILKSAASKSFQQNYYFTLHKIFETTYSQTNFCVSYQKPCENMKKVGTELVLQNCVRIQ